MRNSINICSLEFFWNISLKISASSVLAILLVAIVYAQSVRIEEEQWPSEEEGRIALLTEYISYPYTSDPFLSQIFLSDYRIDATTIKFSLNINKNPYFEHSISKEPDDVEVSSRIYESEVIEKLDSYGFDNPFGLSISHRFDPLEFLFSTHLYIQKGVAHLSYKAYYNPIIKHIGAVDDTSWNVILDPQPTGYKRSDILMTGVIGYSWKGLKILAGVSGLRLIGWGDDTLDGWHPRLLVGIEWPMLGGESRCESNTKEFGFLHSAKLKLPLHSEDRTLRFTVIAKSNLVTYEYKSLELNAQIPLIKNVEVLVGYRKVWNTSDHLLKDAFLQWQSSLSDALNGNPMSGIQHTAVRLGVTLQIGTAREDIPLRLISSKIFHRNIYTAQKDYYAYNPVGTLDIHNTGKQPILCHVHLDLPAQIGSYKSEALKIEPNEVKTIPVYLYLTEQRLLQQSIPVQMDIAIDISGKKHILSSMPLTIYDVHSWDGNTWGLRYYITPDEPTIQTNAKRKFVQSLIYDSSITDSKKKMKQLAVFISEIGRDLCYIQDPTSSLYVDRVQYPIETMELQSGDCEDLAVYIASHLMAVGVQCAFVDVKPKTANVDLPSAGQRQFGHIFLLVNTDIEPEKMGELELNEFQFVSRKSATGKNTLWIPIETTAINQGFEKAFLDGAKQYYEKVIEQNGIKNGLVHVYDL